MFYKLEYINIHCMLILYSSLLYVLTLTHLLQQLTAKISCVTVALAERIYKPAFI